jgi:hypothetical protein
LIDSDAIATILQRCGHAPSIDVHFSVAQDEMHDLLNSPGMRSVFHQPKNNETTPQITYETNTAKWYNMCLKYTTHQLLNTM